jgi:hypothetical protein
MSTDTDLAEALETAMGKTRVNWADVRQLCEEIDRQRKQADAVAARLMGKVLSRDEDLFQQYQNLNRQWFCKDHAPK